MNRRLLLLVTSPVLLIGLVLIIACTVSLVTIHSVQRTLFSGINHKTASRRAVHEMEVALQQLRYHHLVWLMGPSPQRERAIAEDHAEFERALREAKGLCPPEYLHLIRSIEGHYDRYRQVFHEASKLPAEYSKASVVEWADTHPIQQIVEPCEELYHLNRDLVEETFAQSAATIQQVSIVLLVLAVLGPLGGILSGFAIARALSRSIARLQVRVQDVHSQLLPEVGVIELRTDRGIDSMNRQMELIEGRVQQLVERLQSHQRELVRTEQLVIAGRLAASLAHEIRNPLTAMKWLVDAAVQGHPDEPLHLQDLQVLQAEIDRMRLSVQGMLDFVRLPSPHRTRGDLREILHQAVELIRARKRQLGVRCEFDLPPHPVMASVDRAQIKSVVVNLLLNALEAMPRGGQLRVRLEKNGPKLLLHVEDSGPGIAAEVMHRLFTPFVSTKPTGTGLGLSVSRRIVEEHGGELVAENRAEGGARFAVILPAPGVPDVSVEAAGPI